MLRRFLCVLIPTLGLATVGLAGELIQNGNFLQPQFDPSNPAWFPDPSQGPFVYGSAVPIPFWSTFGSSGVWEPNGLPFPGGIPGGGNSAGWTSDGLDPGYLTQDTGYILKAGDSLSLSYFFGDRATLAAIGALSEGEVDLYAGGSLLYDNKIYGPGTTGDWTQFMASFSAAQLAPYVGQDLVLQLSTTGYIYPYYYQGSWVGVSLMQSNAVPEPAPYAVVAAGLGLGMLRRRKRA